MTEWQTFKAIYGIEPAIIPHYYEQGARVGKVPQD